MLYISTDSIELAELSHLVSAKTTCVSEHGGRRDIARDLHGVGACGRHDLGVAVRVVGWGDRRHGVSG